MDSLIGTIIKAKKKDVDHFLEKAFIKNASTTIMKDIARFYLSKNIHDYKSQLNN